MTVFKTFLKILKKNKMIVIMYTIILLVFGATNMSTNENNIGFAASKPKILIVNNDEEVGVTKSFIEYIKENSKTPEIADSEDARNDALFYGDTNYIVYIPQNYHNDFMDGKNPEIEIKRSEDYNSEYAEMLVKRYLSVAKIYQESITSEEELVEKVSETLAKQVKIETTTKLDTTALERATFYFNFTSYSILACLIYIICLVMFVFNEEKVRKRTIISSMNYKKHNRQLLLSNCVFAALIWVVYAIVGVLIIGDAMFSERGLLYVINLFVFTICATTISFLLGSIVKSKGAVTGIMNVVALGSSFLCGVFVPMNFLPDFVVKLAHVLPTYYFVKTNEAVASLEVISSESIKPLIANMSIILAFSIAFIVIANFVARKKRQIG